MKARGCLAHRDHKMIVFSSWRRRGVSKTATLEFQRTDVDLFRKLVFECNLEKLLLERHLIQGRGAALY